MPIQRALWTVALQPIEVCGDILRSERILDEMIVAGQPRRTA